jgi:hypothetical protein
MGENIGSLDKSLTKQNIDRLIYPENSNSRPHSNSIHAIVSIEPAT